MLSKIWTKCNPHSLVEGVENSTTTLETCQQVLVQLVIFYIYLWPSNFTSGYFSRAIKIYIPKKDVLKKLNHNSPKWETTQMSIDKRMGEQTVVYLYKKILLSMWPHACISKTLRWVTKQDERVHAAWFHSNEFVE